MYLGKCLEENNFDAIREDLNKRPIEKRMGEEVQGRHGDTAIGRMGEDEILELLDKYGIRIAPSPPENEVIRDRHHARSPLNSFHIT